MSKGVRRGFDSFKWFVSRWLMVGFGCSSDWLSLTPWTVDGEYRPFVGVTNESPDGPLVWYIMWVGPFCVQFARRRNGDH